MLGSLQNNGGPTQTMAICAAAPGNNLDQRGFPRPLGPYCDIGAYEAAMPPRAFLPMIRR
jgi:hypothetical protein